MLKAPTSGAAWLPGFAMPSKGQARAEQQLTRKAKRTEQARARRAKPATAAPGANAGAMMVEDTGRHGHELNLHMLHFAQCAARFLARDSWTRLCPFHTYSPGASGSSGW